MPGGPGAIPGLAGALLDVAREGILAVDGGGAIRFINSAAASLAGTTPGEALGRQASDVVLLMDDETGEDIPLPAPPPPGGPPAPRGSVCSVIARSGAARRISVTASRLAVPGDMEGWTCYCMLDETWRRVAEDSLRNSNRLFNSIVENSFDAIYILRGRRYEYVNSSFCSITGYSYGELTAPDFDYNVLIVPEKREFMEDRFGARAGGIAIDPHYTIGVRRKDGGTVEVEVVTVPIGRPGEVLVLGIMRDVTERVRAQSEARGSVELMEGILSAMEDTVFRFDAGGRFQFVNSPRIELLMPPARFIGRHYSEILPPQVAELMNQAMGILREGGTTEFEYTLSLSGGAKFYSTRLSPVMHGGRFTGVVSTVRDVTDIKKAELDQKALEEQLQRTQLYESLGMLAGGIAHDFNNILMAIIGNTDTVMEQIDGPESARRLLAEVESSSRKASDLCRQMLTYAGRGGSSKVSLDLNTLILDMKDLLSVSRPDGVSLEFVMGDGLPLVEADPTQIGQVVLNLVKNAFEALPGSGGSVAVRTGAAMFDESSLRGFFLPAMLRSGEYAYIEVSDDGSGLDAGQKEKIFNPFYSTRGPGRGLGLAAVLGISRGHGGSVRVFSEKGQGTTVQVLLPSLRPQGSSPAADVPARRGERAPNGCVLVVDDEEIVRNVLERMLVKIGYTVTAASSGLEAVNIFRRTKGGFDAVILDLAMPGMDGPEVLEFLRGMDPAVRVIIASGYSRLQVEERMGSRTPDGIMQKPFRLDGLLSILGPAPGRPGV